MEEEDVPAIDVNLEVTEFMHCRWKLSMQKGGQHYEEGGLMFLRLQLFDGYI